MAPEDESGRPTAAAVRLSTGVHLRGVSRASPLARCLTASLGDEVGVSTDGLWPKPSAGLRKRVAGTALQWWAEDGTVDAAASPADLVIDLHGGETGFAGRVWRVVDSCGRAALSGFAGLQDCYQPAGVVPFSLVESRDAGRTWSVLRTVALSGSQRYHDLLRGLAAAIPLLIGGELRAGSVPQAWQPGPPRRASTERAEYRFRYLARRSREWLTTEIWACARLELPVANLVTGGSASPQRWLQIPEREGYIADPFPLPGRPDVFLCERYSHQTARGSIAACTIDGDRVVGTEALPLELDVHLSYPFTFAEAGRVFCLPEMGGARHQVMYELVAGAAPRSFCRVANTPMADPTLFKQGERYFIAYTDTDLGMHDNLCLLWADRLEGPWTPHRRNPVKIDVRSSRCGGGLFRIGDRLIRPAQDCARTYGAAIVFNEVTSCTPDEYQEQEVGRLSPDPSGPFPSGLHTVSVADGGVLIDGKKFVFSTNILLTRVRKRLRRLRPARS